MAPRSIWKGSITFGLITIPVKIYTAVGRTARDKIDLHLLHEKDGQRIHYSRNCEKGHKDLDWDEIVKGYEYEKGKWVEITDEDLDALELESLRTIDVMTFAPYDQIDPMYFDKTYYVVPEETAVKAYRLMSEALVDEDLVGIAKVAMREREHLCALRVADNVIVLETMHWPEELREANFDELRKRPKVQDRERKMARQLIQQLAEDFDPTQFTDEYHKALKQLIRKKIKGEEIVVAEAPEEPERVVDLMEALKASVEAARRGEKPRPPQAQASRASKASKASGAETGSKRSPNGHEDLKTLTKQELEERARELDIAGRSKMDKKQLIKAIRDVA
ncbi:MAG TPA: Ku protein [Actinomycetota bacterium]|nr:Ku protein [Actinomycetota bacterium]